jgi:hypothetical protein
MMNALEFAMRKIIIPLYLIALSLSIYWHFTPSHEDQIATEDRIAPAEAHGTRITKNIVDLVTPSVPNLTPVAGPPGLTSALESCKSGSTAANPLSALLSKIRDRQTASLYAAVLSEILKELTRYQEPHEVEDVDHFLIATLKAGPVVAGEEVSEEIFAFIREDNYESYRELAQSLPPESITAQNLKRALIEFARLHDGG